MCALKVANAQTTPRRTKTPESKGRRRAARRAAVPALVLFLAALFAAYPAPHGAQSGAGELDPTFGGGDGRVNDNFGEPYLNQANAVVVQPDGRIVIAAQASFNGRGGDFGLARYNPDGSLDPTFGAGGKVVADINSPNDIPYALALQPDGKLVVAGTTTSDMSGVTTSEFAVARFNPDGSLDQSFGGGDGVVLTDFFANGDTAYAVALQPDGKIIAAGQAFRPNSTGSEFAAARYNPDGTPDTTFGDPDSTTGARLGRVATDLLTWNDIGRGLALQADGKLVVAGYAQTPSYEYYDFGLVRYSADGSLDTTFGGDGRVTTRFFEDDFVDDERAYAVRVQPDGKIIAAGFARDSNETVFATRWEDFALARYNADGSLDTTFGAGGIVVTDIALHEGGGDDVGQYSKDRIHALLLQPDGKLVAGGFAGCCGEDGTEDFALARYNPDGSLDLGFNGDGVIRTDFLHSFIDDEIYGMALQPDGKIVAAGRAQTDPFLSTYDYAIARYTGAPGTGPTPTPTPPPSPSPSPVTPLMNHALAANGATAAASSTLAAERHPSAAINGDRKGLHWGSGPTTDGSGWTDATANAFPDWFQVTFPGTRTVSEVHVFSLQDNFAAPATPTSSMTFTTYGVTDFRIEYWTGSAWATVPGGTVAGNNKVWYKLGFSSVTTNKVRVFITGALAGYSRLTEVEVWGPAPPASPRVNVAASANGATASASSTLDSNRLPAAAINGDRRGLHWGSGPTTDGSGWTDATKDSFPDRLEVSFAGSKTITEVSVFSLQDNYASPVEPTEAMTFTTYGLVDFDIEYWTGSAWAVVPGGAIVGNNKVWRRVTFAPLATTKVRIVVKKAQANYSRVVEVEAY